LFDVAIPAEMDKWRFFERRTVPGAASREP
jgi:hypothetical protein